MSEGPRTETTVVQINAQDFEVKIVEWRGDSYFSEPRLLITYHEYDNDADGVIERNISLPGYCIDKLIDLLPRVRSLYRSDV